MNTKRKTLKINSLHSFFRAGEIKHQTIKIDGIKVGFSEVGTGEPLVLIHGDKYFWETFIPILTKKASNNFRLLTINPPGYEGLKTVEEFNTLAKFCDLLEKIFIKLNLNSFNLAGQSLGSIIALLYASDHPEKIKRLLLLSPPFAYLGNKKGKLLEKYLDLTLKFRPLYRFNAFLHKTRFLNYLAAKIGGFYKLDMEVFENFILPSAQDCNERPAIANTASMLRINHLPLLKKVKSPGAMIVGDGDPVIPVDKAKKIAQSFPNFKLFIIPFAKHAIMIERPKELSEIMIEFLNLN